MIIKRFSKITKIFYDEIDLEYENHSSTNASGDSSIRRSFLPEPHVVLWYGPENARKRTSILLTKKFLYTLALKINRVFPAYSGKDKSKLHHFIWDKNDILLDFLGKSDKEYLRQIKNEKRDEQK